MKIIEQKIENPIKGEIYSVQRLEEYATFLAKQFQVSRQPEVTQQLLPRMRDNGKQLLACYRYLAEAHQRKEAIPPAAEWLTDNFHIIEDQLREIAEDLPPKYYRELPKIVLGELTGYPRIYAIALAIVAHTDSQLDPDTMRRFVQAYQKVAPLGIGELWALAITFRLVLVENLRRMSLRIVSDQVKKNSANAFADQIFEAVANKSSFAGLLKELPMPKADEINEDTAFLAQMTKRLRDQEPELWPALEYLEKNLQKLSSSTEQIVHQSHQAQASNQVSVANIITSMRLISSIDWKDFFESVSLVDRVLERDPLYGKMDFQTRDRYRHVIERIAKNSTMKVPPSEIQIAEGVVALCSNHQPPDVRSRKKSHVGFYLIDKGLKSLEKNFVSSGESSVLAFALRRPTSVYFILMGLLTFLACVGPFSKLLEMEGLTWLFGAAFLWILIPCSEMALQIGNILITNVLHPKNLPKMDYTNGIPEDARTMVVIPCLLVNHHVIRELLEKIEIHYLGNSDPQLFFALLTDFTDAPVEMMAEDQALVDAAIEGLTKLNDKYGLVGAERFFLFHRRRLWNASEQAWIGWERKRGKIEEFNNLLRGEQSTSFSNVTAPAVLLSSIRYVITLDADTQLPRDAAQKLIGTIMHPLHEPIFDKNLGRVVEGYGILQPRIGISLESSTRSIFAKMFSGFSGIDPYTTAVSDVYQDLFQEGSYVGKGLYSVDAFNGALAGKVPDNTILSHDLFEGIYARAALVTDVELIDDYPQSYQTFFTRQHRWTRGDWQIAAWVLPFIKNAKGDYVRNQMPLIAKWKIFDNLRRSLVAVALFVWFILSATWLRDQAPFWAIYPLVIVFLPMIVSLVFALLSGDLRKGFPKIKATLLNTFNSWIQGILFIAFLPHQSVIQLDAIVRVFYRQHISKSKLLEWTTSSQVETEKGKGKLPFWQTPWVTQLALLVALFLVVRNASLASLPILFLLAVWMCYPILANFVSRRRVRKKAELDTGSQQLLRQIARRTWNYFENYVTPEDHWLPPDNHQEFPSPVTAHRTSPTNMGLYLLALSAARDLGYISALELVRRLSLNIATLAKMSQYEGHYFNWYDTTNLEPLNPQYISTVDSGNLAGYLLTTRETCLELFSGPVISKKMFDGFRDVFHIILTEMDAKGISTTEVQAVFAKCEMHFLRHEKPDFFLWKTYFSEVAKSFSEIKGILFESQKERENPELLSALEWADIGIETAQQMTGQVLTLLPWTQEKYLDLERNFPSLTAEQLVTWKAILDQLNKAATFQSLFDVYSEVLVAATGILKVKRTASAGATPLAQFILEIQSARESLAIFRNESERCAQFLEEKFKSMNFEFLLNKERGVFTVGYSVTDRKFDNGYYDLLASESRLASFIAIAKGDVPQKHWFRLGRQLVPTTEGRALVSWTASMFEYIMPTLVMRDYENTLLEETLQTVVARQISYGRENGIPWGISEAGYNARDMQLNYQYGPFGVPGLGLKSGLSHDLVISPYSTCLAALVDPVSALQNMRRLIKEELLTDFGFYESVDYTAERLPKNKKSIVIRSFMAHHQGMSLVALDNVLNGNIMQNRFHRDLRVRASVLLLQEKIPQGLSPALPKAAEIELEDESPVALSSFVRRYNNPNTATPCIQLLSNRKYSIMISTAGGGYSRFQEMAVSRWREDATADNWGQFIFIRDLSEKRLWCSTYQPLNRSGEKYEVIFGEEKVEFKRQDGDISTDTQILVAPEDNVEIRHVTLTNHSDEGKVIELTSYLEPVLAKPMGDLDHQAFSKLFLQTEFLTSKNTLLIKRRKRSQHESEPWGIHGVISDTSMIGDVEYETDRAKFIGRGRNLTNAIAISEGLTLSNSVGATLDPILSLRIRVLVPANAKVQVAFTTGVAGGREEALELADRYHDIHSFERESKLAWTKSQVDMRHLNINSETAYLYQKVAERLLYSEPTLRPSTTQRTANTNTQSRLWAMGISGDLPLIAIRIKDQKDLLPVRQLLRCHEYLRLKGLVYDLVIVNDHATTYYQGLQDDINEQIRSMGSWGWINKPGGIFILRSDLVPEKDIAHIQAVARISLSADLSLKEQIHRKVVEEKYPPTRVFWDKSTVDRKEEVLPKPLDFFNGLGGFSDHGKEYVTMIRGDEWTPAPWINVIGNRASFGFQVSESGSGFTWSVNSQANRLTPWSNDPVCDPPGEIIYLRDEESGEIWNPTPLPIRCEKLYVIRHGIGYSVFEHTNQGIQSSLTMFVPEDESIKISFLKLKNLSGRPRKISFTSYTDWVLGTQREKTYSHLVCEVDTETGSIFAKNPYDNEFSNRVAFADITADTRTFTCSRKEFLGRNGSYRSPSALKRTGLSQRRGTGQDPCAVLQTVIEIEAGAEFEMAVLLGQCEDSQSARTLNRKYRDLKYVKESLLSVQNQWKKRTGTIQVRTPDLGLNLLMNSWLLYQTLSCRYWSRTAFYQSGGAFGFRDQLQDCMAFVYSAPEITRDHILRAARRQFKEGDVQHWWHPPSGRGVRTRMTDDLLWLPYVVAFYIRITGDRAILDEVLPFIEAPPLKEGEEDSYTVPEISKESATLLEHCLRTIQISMKLGEHGLPLIGTGDWNDGMNRVGAEGRGESVWLGWFLYNVITDFLPFCDPASTESFGAHLLLLKKNLEKAGWDGQWYKRAFFDDGSPLGSSVNEECRIDSIAQSWSVLSKAGDAERSKMAMSRVYEILVKKNSKLVLLFTPPFDKTVRDPGYIKGYVPGVRENGGQYTHAAIWVMMAFADLGDGDRAYEIFDMLNPIRHAMTPADCQRYKVEPYVLAGDVYGEAPHEGRGGWSWYTGSSGWYYRGVLESMLGFQLHGDRLKLQPCIPKQWSGFEIEYIHKSARYIIRVENPSKICRGEIIWTKTDLGRDGGEKNKKDVTLEEINDPAGLCLADDGGTHRWTATLIPKE